MGEGDSLQKQAVVAEGNVVVGTEETRVAGSEVDSNLQAVAGNTIRALLPTKEEGAAEHIW
jgi:hypothetical protein